ncbi:hypothetical protein FACS1894199_15010 [Bacteroidia bacterium]|nr:hypothetical protein FACS1894199_15010 [Bacteroidia bacterium]
MKTKNLLAVIAACVLLGACEKEETHKKKEPDAKLAVRSLTINVKKEAGNDTLFVYSNTEWTATIDDATDWCSISHYTGNGDDSIILTIEANPLAIERTTTITLQAGTLQRVISVIQAASEATISVLPTFIYPEAIAGSYSITVTSNVEWTTEIKYITEQGWCTLAPTSGSGNGVINVNLLQNPNSRRSAIITIKSGNLIKTDTIVQHGVPSAEVGVTINGITWATRNVDGFGAFADLSNSPGKYYQFNMPIGYSYIDGVVVPVLNSSVGANGKEWSLINNPSPEGWRIPSYEETQNLQNSGYRYVSEDNGAWFGPDAPTATFSVPNNAIFIPIIGALYSDIMMPNEGRYWVNSVPRDYDPSFAFQAAWGYPTRRHALPIRCVKE